MKKFQVIKSIMVILVASYVLTSCSKMPVQSKLIPIDAAFVGVVDVTSIATKGKLTDPESIKMLKSTLQTLQDADNSSSALMQSMVDDPSKSGVDVLSDLYMYSVLHENQKFFCVSFKIDDKSKFQDNLEGLLGDDFDLKEKEGYIYYSNEKNQWIAFDGDAAVFVSALQAKPEDGEAFVEKLFTQKKDQTIGESKEFNDFLKEKKDISFWFSSTHFLAALPDFYTESLKKSLEEFDGLTITDIQNNYLHMHMNFDDDNINFSFKIAANEAFQKYLESKSFTKEKINEELFAFFPQKSYLMATYSVDPAKLQTYLTSLKDYKSLEKEMSAQGIDLKQFFSSFAGDIMLSLYDVSLDIVEKKSQTYSVNAKGQYEIKDTIIQKENLIPKASLIMSMNDDVFFNKLMKEVIPAEFYKKTDTYFDFSEAIGYPMFVGFQKNMLMISTDANALSQLAEGGYAENFSSSEVSQEIEGYSFYYINLDYETYPLQVKEYVSKMGVQHIIQPYTTLFESITITSEDDMSALLKINLKSDASNSLLQVLHVLDSSNQKQ